MSALTRRAARWPPGDPPAPCGAGEGSGKQRAEPYNDDRPAGSSWIPAVTSWTVLDRYCQCREDQGRDGERDRGY
ncbi:MAG: hypothetical protein M3Y33_14250 [Actinomycetota bacterium]|nr:hypothetical protein [Actinomycetota bacterium]